MAFLVAGASSASAGPLREAATPVVSALPNVAGVGVPSPPAAPTTPPVQVETQVPPQVNSAPAKPLAADPPREAIPTSSQPESGIAGDVGSGLADAATEIAEHTAQGAGAVTPHAEAGSDGPGAKSQGAGPRSAEPDEAASLRRLLAYVWPAIALGPFGELLTALRPGTETAASPLISGARRLPSAVTANSAAAGAADRSGHAANLGVPTAETRGISIPGGGEIPFFVLVVSAAALTALLVAAVRRELGSMYRWWPH